MLLIAIAIIGLALGETIEPNNNNNDRSLIWYPVEVQSNSNNNLNPNIFSLYLYGLRNFLNQQNQVNCKDGCKQTYPYPNHQWNRGYPIYSQNPIYYDPTQYQNAYLPKITSESKSVMFLRKEDVIASTPNNGGSTSTVDSINENGRQESYNENRDLTNFNHEGNISTRIVFDVSTAPEESILDEVTNMEITPRSIPDYNEADLVPSIENKIHSDTNHTEDNSNVLEIPKKCLSENSNGNNDNKTSIFNHSSRKVNTTIASNQNDLDENKNKKENTKTITNNRDNIETIEDENKTKTIQKKIVDNPGDYNPETITIELNEQQTQTDDDINARELGNFEIGGRTDKNIDRIQINSNDTTNENINKTKTSKNRDKGITNYDYGDDNEDDNDNDDDDADEDYHDHDDDDDDDHDYDERKNIPADLNINKSVQAQQGPLNDSKELSFVHADEEERVTEVETEIETSTNKDKSKKSQNYDIDDEDNNDDNLDHEDDDHYKIKVIILDNKTAEQIPINNNTNKSVQAQGTPMDTANGEQTETEVVTDTTKTETETSTNEDKSKINQGYDIDDDDDLEYKTKIIIADNTNTEINKDQPTINKNEERKTKIDTSLINQRYGTDDDEYSYKIKIITADNKNTEQTPINESRNSAIIVPDTNQNETVNQQSIMGVNLNESKIEKNSSTQLFKIKHNKNDTISADKNNNKHNFIVIVDDNINISPINNENNTSNNSTNISQVALPFIRIIKPHDNLQDENSKIRENLNATSFFKKIKKCIGNLANSNDESSQNVSYLKSCCMQLS